MNVSGLRDRLDTAGNIDAHA
ncbi:hypothetical protein AGR2A_Cc160306 [Agrobacterium genomosp. 2 str. CFBP 5494]|uniref:Uncharacterized protein n=1 Tax=Agrobacterium genomosp. 2 str. CFBP 5494 TaxID=1183436 RepID=A0A9W5B027_9HYPH|nr:hypothetical protein AGR2A_Cc160306 [Agrobacterium genomosp. 2 str. CFBP 5494]